MATNNNNDQLRVGVIGMGPVGTILAAHLAEAGAYVIPCDIITTKMDKIKKSGLRLKNVFEKSVPVPDVSYSVKELGSFDLDLAVISVKTPSLKKVISQLAEIASDKLYVMCAQNGIDNEVMVAREFGDDKTLRMVVNYAGSMSDANTVHVSFFNPPNYIACLSANGRPIVEKIAGLLNSVDMDTEIPEDIQDYIWEKAILNAALSAVCAISRKTMKDVMDFPFTLELVEAIIDESVRVAEMEGIELGRKFRRFCIRYLKNAGHHRPSMLIDLENGARTEIDQLNGKIVEYGRKHCKPTPLNHCVTALVHLLEYTVE
jgi:2-dehydropantoate 2-reductase